MIGQTISHYKILEKLGEGGMGVVYKAEDTRLKRTVALKFLSPQAVGTEEDKTRFIHEARAAAALNHDNICTIHEIDEHEGQSFITMEYVEGESIKEITRRGPLELSEALDIIIQAAAGLGEAHEKGIIHRDIKSANVMLTAKGRAKIMDFGLALSPGRTQITRTGTTVGTVAYMSPEQARGGKADQRSDIWSLGVMLYEMLSGRLPFEGDYDQAIVYLILNEEPDPLSKMIPDVPSELERVVGKALAKSKGERYDSVETLLKDLKGLKRLLESNLPLDKASDKASKPSIAVLPFRDMSAQKDQEYFCEGIAEELINALVKLDGLRVVARTSAFQFKGQDIDVKEIASQLDVKTVLEGSVRKAGDRLRITAQLINAADGFHIWSEKYDRQLNDIFAIQDEISLVIVDKLKVRLLVEERSELVKRHTANQEAHNLYLKGLYFWNRRLEGGMKMAIEHFRLAIEKDPGYTFAHVGIADTYNVSGLFGYSPPRETFAKAKAAAKRTLEIDDSMGEAHASLAFSSAIFDWDWSTAENEFKRAIELNPSYATAHEWYAVHLWAMGRFDDAIAEAEKARELDPLSLIINSVVGIAYYFARRYEESIAHHKKALEMDPNFLLASTYSTLAYVECGRYDEVIDLIRRAEPLAMDHTYSLGYFGGTYGRAGQKDDALRILARLDELSRERYVSALHRANVLVGIGEIDEALDNMDKAYAERCPVHTFSNTIPYFDCLQSNQRFRSLMKKIGF